MSFRKRNVVIGTAHNTNASPAIRQEKSLPVGVRPSPLDGRLTTSTGTPSLDQLLAGHGGVPLGTSLLVQEAGTTDFGGTLLRYYVAEGLVQGHQVHVLGYGDSWRKELPGLGNGNGNSQPSAKKGSTALDDRMKIAWRYENLGNASKRPSPTKESLSLPLPKPGEHPFCHCFDLTKRLESTDIKGQIHTTLVKDSFGRSTAAPLGQFLSELSSKMQSMGTNTVHRVVCPGLLSPTLYTSSSRRPREVLQLVHGLRGLLRRYPTQLTVIVTMPITLFARSTGLTRWLEILFDGVFELVPLQHQSQMVLDPGKEDKSQGLLRVHSLPIFHEKGGGLEGSWVRQDLSFKLSASSGLVITPYSLPPVGEEEEATGASRVSEDKKDKLEF